MTDTRLSPEELAAIKERRAQACANNAIEGVRYAPEQNAMFVQFDNEALPHEERVRRAILHIKSGLPSLPSEPRRSRRLEAILLARHGNSPQQARHTRC